MTQRELLTVTRDVLPRLWLRRLR